MGYYGGCIIRDFKTSIGQGSRQPHLILKLTLMSGKFGKIPPDVPSCFVWVLFCFVLGFFPRVICHGTQEMVLFQMYLRNLISVYQLMLSVVTCCYSNDK